MSSIIGSIIGEIMPYHQESADNRYFSVRDVGNEVCSSGNGFVYIASISGFADETDLIFIYILA